MDVDLLYKYWYTGPPLREIFAYNTHTAGTASFIIGLNPYPECKTNLWIQIKIKMLRTPHAYKKEYKYAKSYTKSGKKRV
jgi:hypothetical protein